jgi:hypothetical protein
MRLTVPGFRQEGAPETQNRECNRSRQLTAAELAVLGGPTADLVFGRYQPSAIIT